MKKPIEDALMQDLIPGTSALCGLAGSGKMNGKFGDMLMRDRGLLNRWSLTPLIWGMTA